MLAVRTHNAFEKSLKRVRKRGKNLTKLWRIVEKLQHKQPLDGKHRPHKLSGEWAGFWECHIEPDWLLIYHFTASHLELLETGTHADLFE